MEAERQKEKTERQVAKKNTAKLLADKNAVEAAEARKNSPALQAVYDLFVPSTRTRGRPKFIADRYGNRVRSGMETKKKEN